MAAQGAFGTEFYDRSTRTIVGTMLWTEYRPVIKIGLKGALGSHEIRPIHSATSLGQSIERSLLLRVVGIQGVHFFAASFGWQRTQSKRALNLADLHLVPKTKDQRKSDKTVDKTFCHWLLFGSSLTWVKICFSWHETTAVIVFVSGGYFILHRKLLTGQKKTYLIYHWQ